MRYARSGMLVRGNGRCWGKTGLKQAFGWSGSGTWRIPALAHNAMIADTIAGYIALALPRYKETGAFLPGNAPVFGLAVVGRMTGASACGRAGGRLRQCRDRVTA
jgi:hypothetical protein